MGLGGNDWYLLRYNHPKKTPRTPYQAHGCRSHSNNGPLLHIACVKNLKTAAYYFKLWLVTNNAMRAVVFDKPGMENVRVMDVEVPRPGPNDVLVRVKYAGVNPVDYFTINRGR